MTTLNWNNVEVLPLAIGGAALVYVQMDSATPYTTVRVFAGLRAPTSALDAGTDLVQVDIGAPTNQALGARGTFWGAPATVGVRVKFYGLTPLGAWEIGPLFAGVSLVPSFAVDFPWSPDWVVARLAEIAINLPPFTNGKPLRVTRAFPRDTHSWPAVNVQVDAMNPAGTIVGDYASGANTAASPGPVLSYSKVRLYGLTLSITGWCGTPEERSLLGRWMGTALEVVLDAAAAIGWPDPSPSLRETEDFETLPVPAFLVNAGLTVTVQATLNATLPSSYRATMIATPDATSTQAGESTLTYTSDTIA